MYSIPPLQLFSGPKIVRPQPHNTYIPPLPYKQYESYIIDYDDYYNQFDKPEDQEKYIPIQSRLKEQSKYTSPFATLAEFERTPPAPTEYFKTIQKQKEQEQLLEKVPILEFIPPPNKDDTNFYECGLPNGYAELDRQRQIEEEYNYQLNQQLKYGYKSNESRPKTQIDQYYRNLKVTYNKEGYIQIDNLQQHQQTEPQKIDSKISNDSYKVKKQAGSHQNNPYYHQHQQQLQQQQKQQQQQLQVPKQQQNPQQLTPQQLQYILKPPQLYSQQQQPLQNTQQNPQQQTHFPQQYPFQQPYPQQYPNQQNRQQYQIPSQNNIHQDRNPLANSEILGDDNNENNESIVQAHPLENND